MASVRHIAQGIYLGPKTIKAVDANCVYGLVNITKLVRSDNAEASGRGKLPQARVQARNLP